MPRKKNKLRDLFEKREESDDHCIQFLESLASALEHGERIPKTIKNELAIALKAAAGDIKLTTLDMRRQNLRAESLGLTKLEVISF